MYYIHTDLVLDPGIRNWGVIPILIFVLCVNLARSYLAVRDESLVFPFIMSMSRSSISRYLPFHHAQHLAKSEKQPEKDELRHK